MDDNTKGPNIHMAMKTGNGMAPTVTFGGSTSSDCENAEPETDAVDGPGESRCLVGVATMNKTLDIWVMKGIFGSSLGTSVPG